jgi:hypothetical protein
MLALADHANDDSVCWPGVERLAFKIRRTERQAQSIIRHLEKVGEIYVFYGGGRHNTNLYFVTLGLDEDEIERVLTARLEVPEDDVQEIIARILDARKKGEENCTEKNKKGEVQHGKGEVLRQKGEVQRRKRVKPATPEPSLESLEPSENRHEEAAPAAPPSDEPKKRQLTGKNALKQQLAEEFSGMTAIPLPSLDTKRQGREAGVKWFNPLLAIAAACDDDLKRTREVIQEAIEQMDADDLTISSPQSIQKTAIGIAARCKRERSEREKHAAAIQESQARGEEIAARRQAEAEAIDPKLKLAQTTWRSACEFMSETMLKTAYALYIKPLVVLKPNGTFRLRAPTWEVYDWLEHRLRPTIEEALCSVVGREVVVEFSYEGEAPDGTGECLTTPNDQRIHGAVPA